MAEIGEVIEEKAPFVKVRLQRQEACGKCKGCIAGMQSQEMIAEALNKCDAHVGDLVEISLEKSNFLKAVAIMYTIPLAALLIGILGGYMITKNELISVVLGLGLTAAAYLVIKTQNHKFETTAYRPIAEKIVKP